MGLGEFLEKKLIGSSEDRFRRKAIEKKAELARWQSRERGAIAKAKHEGYAQGKGTGNRSLLNAFAAAGTGAGNALTGGGNPFDPTPRHRSSSGHGKKKTSSGHGKKKTRHHRRRDQSDFLFG